MNDNYKLVGCKGPELYDGGVILSSYPLINFIEPFTDDTIHMKITIEVRKFWFWWKL